MAGPLPNPNARRRNAPTIPTTSLPAGGRSGPMPKVPAPVRLEAAGRAWWRWAWSTPQAAAWDAGSVQIVARRASLEDDLAAVAEVQGLDAGDVLDGTQAELVRLARRLGSMVTGRLSLVKEMREHDQALGLTPKAMRDLRWQIEPEEQGERPAARVVASDRWSKLGA